MERTWKNLVTTAPIGVEPGDAFAVKIVAVVYEYPQPHWAAYRGPSDWSDDKVAEQGDVILGEAARGIFRVLARTDLPYYD